jgi:hypothetical protein
MAALPVTRVAGLGRQIGASPAAELAHTIASREI